MDFSVEFWVQVGIYLASMGSFAGIVITRLNYLEKKQDKHNNLVERMVVVEQSANKAHERMDELKRTAERWRERHEEKDGV